MLEKAKRRFQRASNSFWGYATLESDPRGAKTRSSKQSQEAEPTTPEVVVHGDQLSVLNYLKNHMDVPITYEDISQGSGVSRSKVGRAINELVGNGTVVRSTHSRQGTRYWINSRGPNSVGKNTQGNSVIGGSEEDNIDFVKTTNTLIWEFIRATRSTDLLLYLTWLEKGSADGL